MDPVSHGIIFWLIIGGIAGALAVASSTAAASASWSTSSWGLSEHS
ncbi:F0F1-type ATP synthase assembly protein I [Paraburkholderia sp. MM5477-R1]